MLTAFIVLQLLLDIEIVLFLVSRYRRRARATARVAAAVPAEPPAWYRDFLLLAEDVLAAVEPLLDALDRGQLPMPASAGGAPRRAPPSRPARRSRTPRRAIDTARPSRSCARGRRPTRSRGASTCRRDRCGSSRTSWRRKAGSRRRSRP